MNRKGMPKDNSRKCRRGLINRFYNRKKNRRKNRWKWNTNSSLKKQDRNKRNRLREARLIGKTLKNSGGLPWKGTIRILNRLKGLLLAYLIRK
jgi:hypothetical protein